MNKIGKQYYREIKTIFPSKGKNERRLLKRYKSRITELCDANPDITYDAILQELGTPIDVITDYYGLPLGIRLAGTLIIKMGINKHVTLVYER